MSLSKALSHRTRLTRSASPLSRACLVAYVVLIVYASLYPFSGWKFESFPAYWELIIQWPHYWTKFDAMVNVIGYVPLGLLVVFSLHPKVTRGWSLFVAILASCLMTLSMESIQFLLPSRVTSFLDLITNALGGALGAILGVFLLPYVLENDVLRKLRGRWFHHEASRETVLLGLWPLAQLFPQMFLFGLGQIFPIFSIWSEEYFGLELHEVPVKIGDWTERYFKVNINVFRFLQGTFEFSAEKYLLSEALITACGCTGAILICLSLLNRTAPKFILACALLFCGLIVKAMTTALMFQPENAFSWLTPGAQGGLVISMIMLYGFSFAPHRAQRRLAVLLILIELIVVNFIPDNPYFIDTLETMTLGKMLNFYGAAQFLSLVWPFAAIWYLLVLPHQTKHTEVDSETA